jgi:hypothetical protein
VPRGRRELVLVHLLDRLAVQLVPLGLSRLREQDQRRGVGGLRREREVQEDERVRPSES